MKMDYPSLSLSVESIQNVLKQHKLESIPPCDTVKHECETCQYQASSYWTLRYHKMTNHLGTQERCNICDYNHPHPTRMKQHYKWAHLGIEYKCEQCDFKTKNLLSTMRSHVKTKHSETKETCTDCDYSHPIASKVKAHYKKIHLVIKRKELFSYWKRHSFAVIISSNSKKENPGTIDEKIRNDFLETSCSSKH